MLFAASVRLVNAQRTPAPADTPAPPWQAASERDHQRTMDLLHIQSIRPGADNNHPDSPNAVNYDESKGNPYAKLPDPLVLNDGSKVATDAVWWNQRRPQIEEAIRTGSLRPSSARHAESRIGEVTSHTEG